MARTTTGDGRTKVTGRDKRRMAEEKSRKRRLYTIVGGIVGAILLVLLAVFVVFQDDNGDSDGPHVVAAASGITAPIDGRVAGEPDAQVAVVEWGDYQCPACAAFEREAAPILIEQYVNTGKITFEFRDFAFLGPESTRAAEAAMCAQDQDKFWDFHSTIYANHDGENQGAYSDDLLKEMAQLLNLDIDQFNACFDDSVHEEDIANMYDEGSAQGVNSTPTLVINGELVRYSGVADLQARLDALLEG